MLQAIDNMLRQLFVTQVPTITAPTQVRFQPPDDDWRSYVTTLSQPALNVYLVELRENRLMRSNGRTRQVVNNIVNETPLPRYVDVHYLITAWDPAIASPGVEPTLAEHDLLWGVIAALMAADPLTASKIYGSVGAIPGNFPAFLDNAELPTTIIPEDGFAKHAEFWGTMAGNNNPWRPAVLLIVTLPVMPPIISSAPMVTTRITEYQVPTGVEMWAEIGGTVTAATVNPPAPVVGASVAIVNTSGVQLAIVTTDSRGRFIFNMIQPGSYQLQFAAAGYAAAPPRDITVPSPTGEYNLQFT
jgi:Pvc16 N-terminal domain/Carboxypeptidase regulatory-like domain